MQIVDYVGSFDLLVRDIKQVLEFVEPTDANAATYSHRLYAILLRVCTDFESLARDLLVRQGCKKSVGKMNVNDYRTLELLLRLESVKIDFLLWRPMPLRVLPFKDWSKASPPLSWYNDYNAVKHNRQAEFPRANLAVVVEALAGQFALISKACDYNWPSGGWSRDHSAGSFWRDPFQMYG
jgi:hypothetical protein